MTFSLFPLEWFLEMKLNLGRSENAVTFVEGNHDWKRNSLQKEENAN